MFCHFLTLKQNKITTKKQILCNCAVQKASMYPSCHTGLIKNNDKSKIKLNPVFQ